MKFDRLSLLNLKFLLFILKVLILLILLESHLLLSKLAKDYVSSNLQIARQGIPDYHWRLKVNVVVFLALGFLLGDNGELLSMIEVRLKTVVKPNENLQWHLLGPSQLWS